MRLHLTLAISHAFSLNGIQRYFFENKMAGRQAEGPFKNLKKINMKFNKKDKKYCQRGAAQGHLKYDYCTVSFFYLFLRGIHL
jgi:hypothetical protein